MEKNIAVIYGGFSSEREISVLSGKYVASVIDRTKFNIYEIEISPNFWKVVNKKNHILDKNDFSIIFNSKKIHIDAVVNVIHGNPGENGKLQAYFDILRIPYVGCNSFASSLTFNKYYCNTFLRNSGINIAKSFIVRKNYDYSHDLKKFIDKVVLPVFVKPSNGGSSFGTTKVKKYEELLPAIELAFKEDDEVMVEEFIEGREITCAVVKINNNITALTPVEIVSKNEFFDFEAKYHSELNEEIIPAPIDEKDIEKIKQESRKIYELLNCDGIVRIDYIIGNKGLYFLELNSIPGMTSESIVPKILRYENINISNLFTKLIEEKL